MRSDPSPGVTWFRLHGELDIDGAMDLAEALHDVPEMSTFVIVEMRDLEFIDAAGMHVLVDATARALMAGQRLVLFAPRPRVRIAFALTGAAEDVEISPASG